MSTNKRLAELIIENAIRKILDEAKKPKENQSKKLIADSVAQLYVTTEDLEGSNVFEFKKEAATAINKLQPDEYLALDNLLNDEEIIDRVHDSGVQPKHPEKQWDNWDWSEDENKKSEIKTKKEEKSAPVENKNSDKENIEENKENDTPKPFSR